MKVIDFLKVCQYWQRIIIATGSDDIKGEYRGYAGECSDQFLSLPVLSIGASLDTVIVYTSSRFGTHKVAR